MNYVPLPRRLPNVEFIGVEILEPDGKHRAFRGFDNWHAAQIFAKQKAPLLYPGHKIIFHSDPKKSCSLFYKEKDPWYGINLDGYYCFHCGREITKVQAKNRYYMCERCWRECQTTK